MSKPKSSGYIKLEFKCSRCPKTHTKRIDLSKSKVDFNRCMEAVYGETGEQTKFHVMEVVSNDSDGNGNGFESLVLCTSCQQGYYHLKEDLDKAVDSSLKKYLTGK